MKENDLISIIVPICNVEQFLEKCINSIIKQTYKNLEIILVNDGSTDNSQNICEEYAKNDNRIRLINKDNGGVGSAKNEGIKNATGKYIGFVDSDDYIENDMYETLYNLCIDNDADISMVGFKKVINGKTIDVPGLTGETIIYNRFEAMKKLLLDNEIKNYSWNKLYKNNVFTNVSFSEKINYEDVEATIKIFENANKVVYKKTHKYNYVQRNNSIVNSKDYNTMKDFMIATKNRYNYLLNKYTEINEYNAIGFISNMVIIYKNSIIYDMEELYKDFEDNYELFITLVKKYKTNIFCELGNYRRLLLSIILWDLNLGKSVVKELENQIEKNITK